MNHFSPRTGKCLAAFLAASFLISVTSCTLGLGSAVDTKSPEIAIQLPETDYIVRESFSVSGTYSDDGEIKSVSVTLKDINTGNLITKEAEFDDKTWSALIEPAKDKDNVPDGSYEATVVITDKALHTTTVTRSFRVDNTPPVIVLQRPSTELGASAKDSYGQVFNITGQAADDSSIDSVEVNIYSMDGTLLQTVPITNVPPTIDLTVAKWGAADGYYKKIYGENEDAGAKDFYCTVTAYDQAKKIPHDENDKGNSVTYFFLYNDIYASLLSKYKVTELYHMLNGSYAVTDENRDEVTAAVAVLKGESNQVKNASFSLNPLNNPTYEVNGLNTVTDILAATNKWDEEGNKLLNNSKLSVSFAAGLDNATIESNTIGIYLKECDADGNPKNGTLTAVDEDHDIELRKPGAAEPLAIVGTGYSTVVSLGTKTSYVNAKGGAVTINLGSYYRFYIEGKDANGKDFLSGYGKEDYDYAFKLNSSGSVPTLIATAYIAGDENDPTKAKPTSFDISNGEGVVITGTLKIEEGEVNIVAEMELPDHTTKTYKTTDPSGNLTCAVKSQDANSKVFEFKLTLPAADFGSGQNTINITANKVNETQKTEKTFTVNLDGEKPTVTEITVDGFEFKAANEYNGIVTIKAYAQDNETVASIDYVITDYAGNEVNNPLISGDTMVTPGDLRSKGFRVDTRDYDKADGTGDVKITIYATDKAGNKSLGTDITLKVNQETDKPKFKATLPLDLVNTAVTDIGTTDNSINLYDYTQELECTVTDDDGLDSVIIYKVESATKTSIFKKENLGGVTSLAIKNPIFGTDNNGLNLSAGKNVIQIYAKDSALGVENQTKEINIFIDKNPLSLSLESVGNEAIASETRFDLNSNFNFKVLVKENDGNLSSLSYSDNGGAAVDLTGEVDCAKATQQTVSVQYTKPAVSQRITRKFTAKNIYNRSKTATIVLNYDLDKPTLDTPTYLIGSSETETAYSSRFVYNANTPLTVKVNAKDDGSVSTKEFQTGLDTVRYALVSGTYSSWDPSWTVSWTDLDKKTKNGTSYYQAKISSDMVDEGEYTVFIKAIDNVGNESAYKYLQVGCDKNNPAVTGTDAPENSKVDVTLSGTLTEKYLDTHSFKLEKYNGSSWTTVTNPAAPGTAIYTINKDPDGESDKDWEVTVAANNSNNGLHRLTVSAKDQVGKTGSWTSSDFRIDTINPVIDNTTDGFTFEKTQFSNVNTKWFNSSSLKLDARYTEGGSGVDSVKIWITPTGGSTPATASAEPTAKLVTGTTDKYGFSVQLNGFAESSGTSHNELKIVATDKAGNESAASTFTVQVDLNAPEIGTNDGIAKVNGEDLSQGGTKLVNGKNNIKIQVPVTDAVSGVKAVTLAFGSKDFTSVNKVCRTATLNNGYYEYEIDYTKAAEKALLTKGAVYVQAVDNADNASESLLFRFNYDETAPEITFTSHEDGNTVNKSITLKGTVQDDQKLAKAVLSVSTDAGSNWTVIGDSSLATPTLTLTGSVWSKVIDTTVYSGTVQFKLTATDNAENVNSKSLSLTVDQNSDRPIIKLGNIASATGVILNTPSVEILVQDDDGIAGLTLEASVDNTNWKPVTLTAGSGTFTPAGAAAGTINLYFRVTDAAGTVFKTNIPGASPAAGYLLSVPYIQYVETDAAHTKDNNELITYTYDAAVPQISGLAMGWGKTAAEALTEAKKTAAAGVKKTALTSSAVLTGGTEKAYVVFEVTATDDIGIGSVSLSGIENVTFTKEGTTDLYYSSAVKVADLSDSVTVSFTATDQCGKTDADNKTAALTVDKTGPEASFTVSATAITGEPEFKGNYSDEGGSTVKTASFKYVVLNDEYYSAAGKINKTLVENVLTGAATVPANGTPVVSTGITHAASGWTIGKLDYTSVPKDQAALTAGYTKVPHDGDNYTLTIAVYLEDALGNYKVSYGEFVYNPFGNRPSASVTYPTGTSAAPAQMNGAVRISGSAEKGVAGDATDVSKVLLQFDMNNDGIFDVEDQKIFTGVTKDGDVPYAVYNLYKDSYYTSATLATELGVASLDDNAIASEAQSFWGIKANGNPTNWYLTVNSAMEFQINKADCSAATDGSEFKIGVRAIAVTTNGILGSWTSAQFIKLDTNIPVVGEEEQVVETKSTRTYESDMYVKGKADLKVTVEDKQKPGSGGISKVLYYTSTTKAGLNSSSAGKGTCTLPGAYETFTRSSGNTYGYHVTVPLSADASATGSLWVKVVAYKENDQSSYALYNINFDNTAPEIKNFKLNSVLYADSDKKIVNSNGLFTLSGQMEDMDAGFERAAFYYYRGKGTAESPYRMYDPMSADGRILTASLATEEMVTDINLYGAKQTVTIATSASGVSTVTLVAADAHIKKGGLACVEGTYIKISGKAGNVLTLERTSPKTGSVEVFFPYAQVVDNTGSEKPDADGLSFTTNADSDDGDGMPESIIKSQHTWTWDASIQSKNIPDGPGKMVVVIWDKAGNVSAAEYACSVQNNAPRLVKLHLGTDLSGDGKFTDDEFTSYDVLEQDGRQSSYVMSTAAYKGKSFRVKDTLAVVPEFVGGNITAGSKDIKMILNRAADSETKISLNTKTSGNKIMDADGETADVFFTDAKTSILDAACTLVSGRGSTLVDGVSTRNNIWAFLVDNYNVGVESPNADVNSGIGHRNVSFTFWDTTEDTEQGVDSCYMYLKLTDLIVDVVDNTPPVAKIHPFYWNSWTDSSVALDSSDMPLGHIDLEADINATEPNVAGTILFRGYAYDATKVRKIFVKEPGATNAVLVGQWNVTDKKWEKVTTNWPAGWEDFEVTDDTGITKDGQTVEFTFKMNMTKYGVANTKTLYVYAEDGNSNSNSDDSAQTTAAAETNKYTVNCVPYIQKLAVVDGTTETALSRSRLGRYVASIKTGRKLRIYGMNFTSSATYTVNFYKSKATTGKQDKTVDVKVEKIEGTNVTKANGYIDVAMPEYSCWVEVVVGTVATPNNTNGNKKYNILKGTLNESTGKFKDGENFWTDDVYLSVWNVGTSLNQSYNTIAGTLEKFTADNAKKFEEGQNYTTDISQNTALGVWAANDKMMHDCLVMNGAKRQNNVSHSANNCYGLPVSEIDVCVYNNIPFYVINENGLTGSGQWGSGLLMLRDGQKTENMNNDVIEKQGNGGVETPVLSDGMDEMLFQFKNPKIDVYDDDSYYYMYTCYYDSFARCLKYGKAKTTKNDTASRGDLTVLVNSVGDNATTGIAVVDGYDVVSQDPNYRLTDDDWDVGLYSDIKVDNSGIPYIVYYDRLGKSLKIAKGKSSAPTTGKVRSVTCTVSEVNGKKVYTNHSETDTDGTEGWDYATLSRPEGCSDFGRYVSMERDNAGGLHIVAQDVTNSVVYYGYLSEFSASTAAAPLSITWQKVDSVSSVGRWTDIKLEAPGATAGTNGIGCKPIITYQDTAYLNTNRAVKVAYVCNYTSVKKNQNAYADVTLAVWDTMTVPAEYEASDMKLSIVPNVLDAGTTPVTNKLAVGFNSTAFAVDFLRDEQ